MVEQLPSGVFSIRNIGVCCCVESQEFKNSNGIPREINNTCRFRLALTMKRKRTFLAQNTVP
jgi:hypothetical protein